MAEGQANPLNIICFATFFKGSDFIRECKKRGSNVILITKEKMLDEEWPRDLLADLFAVPNDAPDQARPGRCADGSERQACVP